MEDFIKRLTTALNEYDIALATTICREIESYLSEREIPIDFDSARTIMKLLRSARQFNLMQKMAQVFSNDGCDDLQVQRQNAQALIENGYFDAAIGLLERMVQNSNAKSAEYAEAHGLLGRAWKEKALVARNKRIDVAKTASRNSYEHYRGIYDVNKSNYYHGINKIAIAAWDDGLALGEEELQQIEIDASDIYNDIRNKSSKKIPHWDLATAGEALVAMKRIEEAIEWYGKYVIHKDIDAFSLNSSIRQLSDVWKIEDTEVGQSLLAPLRARLLELPGGSFSLTSENAKAMASVGEDEYEKILGNKGARTYTWMQNGFKAAESVALVREGGAGIGTGFLVKGSDLHDGFGDEFLILTNAHVVSSPPKWGAIAASEASITFEISDDKTQYDVKEVVWQSEPDKHDAALLRVNPPISDTLRSLKLTDVLPPIGGDVKQYVYIIGHPRGGELSFSFHDNELLDYESVFLEDENNGTPCKIHYRTPTEKGSSGSPVFNSNWSTIAIHHKGSTNLPKLNGAFGEYPANEGIWIESIRRALKIELG